MLVALLVAGCPEAKTEAPKASGPKVNFDAAPTRVPGKHAGNTYQEIRYENSNDGLRRLMRDIKTGILAEDEEEIAVLLASLRLEDDESFMKLTFGDKLGATLSAEYKPHREEIGVLAKHLKRKFEDGLSTIETFSFESPDMQTATGYQSAALAEMETKVPLYSVRFLDSDRKQSFHLWSFVHFEGSFRYIGKLTKVATEKRSGGRDLNELRIEDAERLITQER